MSEEKIAQIEERLEAIEKRNKKVEADKAWETSLMRKFVIFVLTYFVMVIFMYFVGIEFPWVTAIVPALAYLLSTLSMPYFKRDWIRKKRF